MSRAPRAEPVAWVLNLEAEHELERAGAFTPSAALRAIVAAQRARLLCDLVAPGDVVLAEDGVLALDAATGALAPADPRAARGRVGLCWSPTRSALARLARAGARAAEAPGVATLRAVNARAFAAGVRGPLARGSFAKDVAATLDHALALLARPAPDGWLVRRAFGAAGRGRRRIAAGAPDPAERAWLAAGLARGPLVLEPWVRVVREHTRSGFVARDGRVVLSGACFQRTTRAGAWIATERAPSVAAVGGARDRALARAAAAAGEALAAAGYFGPFGIDAFEHRSPGGRAVVLNPLSEINARFTMDWAGAFGPRAPVLALGG